MTNHNIEDDIAMVRTYDWYGEFDYFKVAFFKQGKLHKNYVSVGFYNSKGDLEKKISPISCMFWLEEKGFKRFEGSE